MAKDANQFIFREEYEEWLRNLGIKSAGAYCPQDKYTCNDGREFLFFDLIGVFAKKKNLLSSISLHDTLRKKTRQTQQMVYMSVTKH